MVCVESGSDSESTLDDRDLHEKSTILKHYEKPSRNHAKRNVTFVLILILALLVVINTTE